jgi:heparanase
MPMGGAPKGYDAAAYGRDVHVFVPFLKKASPDTIILGPGGVGEGIVLAPIGLAGDLLRSEDLLKATGPVFDAFSYHSYGATSKRCASMGPASQTGPEAALSEELLSRADRIEQFYSGLRDRFESGKPTWLTKMPTLLVAEILGLRHFSTAFVISIRWADWLHALCVPPRYPAAVITPAVNDKIPRASCPQPAVPDHSGIQTP